MGKWVNTKVVCFGCGGSFMTPRMKMEGEFYECPKCGHTHVACEKEVDGGWIHCDADFDEERPTN